MKNPEETTEELDAKDVIKVAKNQNIRMSEVDKEKSFIISYLTEVTEKFFEEHDS